jgi:hypothetical protein
MTTAEFFSYLLEQDASHKLAVELADIYRARIALSQTAVESSRVQAR